MVESVLDHWGLVLRGEALDVFQSGHIPPVNLVEQWVSGAYAADYRLTTGADDRQACRLLLEDFEPSPAQGTKEEVLAGFLTRPAICNRFWAAATAWEQTLDAIGALPEEGMSGLDKGATDPILHAVKNAPTTVYPWAGDYPLEGPDLLAVALWQGSGLGSDDGTGGFGAAYYEAASTEPSPPYCGRPQDGDADDKVLIPMPCPRPPSMNSCAAPAAVEEATPTGGGAAASRSHETAPADESFAVPQCSAMAAAEQGRPISADPAAEIRYEWSERWWDPDGRPVNPPGTGTGASAGNCRRPAGADGQWVLSLCADEVLVTRSAADRNGVQVSRTVANSDVLQADWFWSPPPARPRFGSLLAGVLSWGWVRAGSAALDCSVPRSRLSESDVRQREDRWVYVTDAPVYGSDAPHLPFLVDGCMADAVLALFELADSHGIALTIASAARTWDHQLDMRRENCPAGEGATTWTMHQLLTSPARLCDPVTAPPGRSRHSTGLAIDLNCNSFDHPCYRWLAENAGRLGFHGMGRESGEPWHWAATPPLPLF